MIERIELAGALVLVGLDAAAVGEAARLALADEDEARQVLVFVGPRDAPELAAMLAELRVQEPPRR